MAKTNKPAATQKMQIAMGVTDVDDLPEVVSMGLAKAKGGWCVLLIKTQGYEVTDAEVLAGPDPRAVAVERYKIESVRQLFPHLDLRK